MDLNEVLVLTAAKKDISPENAQVNLQVEEKILVLMLFAIAY